MTSITFQDGQPIMRGGQVGTSSACCCRRCSGSCDKNAACNGGGQTGNYPDCYCVESQCVECAGECADDGDCTQNCKCTQGECVGRCSGPCINDQECSPGCICRFGECVRCEGCVAPPNCTLTLTVTKADGSTFTLTHPDTGPLMSFEFGPCSVSAFYGDLCGPELQDGEAYNKVVELVCAECCDDGTARNCQLGGVVAEQYTNTCPGFEGQLFYTNFSFALNCDPAADPCNEFP